MACDYILMGHYQQDAGQARASPEATWHAPGNSPCLDIGLDCTPLRWHKLWWKGDNRSNGGVETIVKEKLVEKALGEKRRRVRVLVVLMVIGKVTSRMISEYAGEFSLAAP